MVTWLTYFWGSIGHAHMAHSWYDWTEAYMQLSVGPFFPLQLLANTTPIPQKLGLYGPCQMVYFAYEPSLLSLYDPEVSE